MNDELDKIIPFSPTGSDERQYCSPGINLPIGALMRTPNSEFAEYHTSADNLDFISSHHLEDSYKKVVKMISVLENDYIYNNLFPYCEPQLGKRDLYRNIGGQKINLVGQTSIKWILNYSDGESSLVDIAKMSKIDFFELLKWSKELEDHGLIEKIK